MEAGHELQYDPKVCMSAHDDDYCAKLASRASVFAAHLAAALLRLLGAARLPYNISRRRVLLRGQGERPKIKQEMLLHKIGAFWDGPGWTKHRRALWRAITVRLCHATAPRHAVGLVGI